MTAVLSLTSCSKSHSLGRLGESGNQSKWKKCFCLQATCFFWNHPHCNHRCRLRQVLSLKEIEKKGFSQIHHNSSYPDNQVVETLDTFLASGREWSRNRADAGWPQATQIRWNTWSVFFAFYRSHLLSFPNPLAMEADNLTNNFHAHSRTQPMGPLCLWQYIYIRSYQVCRHSYMEVLHSVPRWKSWQRTGGWWS